MSLIQPENFTEILRVMNTNIDGNQKIMYAMTGIKGIGRRFSNLICKKGEVDLNKRAGELKVEELEALMEIVQNPEQYKIPVWFLNRQKDYKDGKNLQSIAQGMDNKWREDFDRMKKARVHRGLRHWWGWKVRGQHTKTTGRRGKTVGIGKKK